MHQNMRDDKIGIHLGHQFCRDIEGALRVFSPIIGQQDFVDHRITPFGCSRLTRHGEMPINA